MDRWCQLLTQQSNHHRLSCAGDMSSSDDDWAAAEEEEEEEESCGEVAPLHWAAAHGFAATLQHLLDLGADVNAADGRSGNSALHVAAVAGQASWEQAFGSAATPQLPFWIDASCCAAQNSKRASQQHSPSCCGAGFMHHCAAGRWGGPRGPQ